MVSYFRLCIKIKLLPIELFVREEAYSMRGQSVNSSFLVFCMQCLSLKGVNLLFRWFELL